MREMCYKIACQTNDHFSTSKITKKPFFIYESSLSISDYCNCCVDTQRWNNIETTWIDVESMCNLHLLKKTLSHMRTVSIKISLRNSTNLKFATTHRRYFLIEKTVYGLCGWVCLFPHFYGTLACYRIAF